MGSRSIGTSSRIPSVTRSPAEVGPQAGISPPPGCPDLVTAEGARPPGVSVGDDAALTLAAGQLQLLVGGKVTSIVASTPGLDVIRHCLEQGEKYFGEVASVSDEQVRAVLARG